MSESNPKNILVTGGTGYIGRPLLTSLMQRGHRVRALCRKQSVNRLPAGVTPVIGNALEESSVASALQSGDILIQLIGTPHPSPAKAKEFQEVDLVSIQVSVAASRSRGVSHFIYLSVAQPAPVMKAYLSVRAEGERLLREAGLTSTVLRPWYVLGPGHRWPLFFLPFYGIASLIPSTREGAQRLGFVSLRQMVNAIVNSVENPPPPATQRILDVPAIRGFQKNLV